jgi:hypothetical protein
MAQYTFPPLSQPFLDPGGQLQDLAGRKTESSIELEVRSQFSPASCIRSRGPWPRGLRKVKAHVVA